MAIALGELFASAFKGDPFIRRSLRDYYPVIRSVNVGTLSAVSAATTSEQTVTVAGLNVGDVVFVNKPTH